MTAARRLALFGALWALAGATGACGPPVRVIGRAGVSQDGDFRQPRALAVSAEGLVVIDRTGRLQIFDLEGGFLSSFTVVPGEVRRGLPVGVAWLPDGGLAVADTHGGRVRLLDRDGTLRRAYGGYGVEPGQFLYPQRVALDGEGNLVVTDHGLGKTNRVQVIAPDGRALRVFGGPRPEDGGLRRPMGIALLPDGGVYVADESAGIVHFDSEGRCLGPAPGWPADTGALLRGLCRTPDGTLYATDLEGDRLLRLDADGRPTGVFGEPGEDPGQFRQPWDVVWHDGYLYVADTGNHRVQRIDLSRARWGKP
jgi:DNA-binding beta-propeller fold protein YncE